MAPKTAPAARPTAQAIRNCDLHEMEEVTEIIKSDDDEYHFTVKTAKDEYKTKTVILATGSSHRHLNAKGEEEFKGKGVSYCATCDGFFFQGRDIVMVGGGNSALQEALYLNNLGANVTLIHRRDEFRAQKHLQVGPGHIQILSDQSFHVRSSFTIRINRSSILTGSVAIPAGADSLRRMAEIP